MKEPKPDFSFGMTGPLQKTLTSAIAAAALLTMNGKLLATNAPVLLDPADASVLTTPIPHFLWQTSLQPLPGAMPSCAIQIATNESFAPLLDEDLLPAVINWYVPGFELSPGNYWWRMATVDALGVRGSWTLPRRFVIQAPTRVLNIQAGANWTQIENVFTSAALSTPVLVQFEPSNYVLTPGTMKSFINFVSVKDVIIDGRGSTLSFTEPVRFIDIEHCQRVMVKNLTFDIDPLPYTAGRVTRLGYQSHTNSQGNLVQQPFVEMRVLPGHQQPTAFPPSVMAPSNPGIFMVVSEKENFAVKRGVNLVINYLNFEQVAPFETNTFRFTLQWPGEFNQLATNDVVILNPRWTLAGVPWAVNAAGGSDVVFRNLTIRSAANECLASYYSDRHVLSQVKLERTQGRILSVNNAGANHHNARTGPWIEGCFFENVGDDVCSINGYRMVIQAQPATNRVTIPLAQYNDPYCTQMKLDLRVGDRLAFFNRVTGTMTAETTIAALSYTSSTADVTVTQSLTNLVLNTGGPPAVEATEVYNLSRICNQFVFRNNFARTSRRGGITAKGSGGLIENNTFEALGGGGVEFYNESPEGFATENYVVRNNLIVDCGRLNNREHGGIFVRVIPSGSQLQRNLIIADNVIRGFPAFMPSYHEVSPILVKDTRDTLLTNNTIISSLQFPTNRSAVSLANTSGMVLNNPAVKQAVSFATWSKQFFTPTELLNIVISGPEADPDGDGIPNLLEYALALDPRSATPNSPLTLQVSPASVQGSSLSYSRSMLADGLAFSIESSQDLGLWTNVVHYPSVVSAWGSPTERWTLVDRTAVSNTPTRFYRLGVTNTTP